MPKVRSPVLGYNHNIRHLGWLFHVQTEDSGVQSPHIFTHLFHSGVILTSKKYKYDPELDETAVKLLMQSQHKSVMKELKSGKLDEKIHQYLKNMPKDDPSGEEAQEAARNWEVREPGRAQTEGDPAVAPVKKRRHSSVQFIPSDSPGSEVSFDAPSLIEPDVTEKSDRPPSTDPPVSSVQQRLVNKALATRPPGSPPPIPRSTSPKGSPSVGPANIEPRKSRADTVVEMAPQDTPPPRKTASRGSQGNSDIVEGTAAVVVSPPSVIVGAPSKQIGGEQDGAVEGPLISEKSLDEVILAYLSEDSKDDI